MATKNNMTKEQLRAGQKKSSDAVVYKVMIALAVLCGALLGLQALRDYYATVEGFSVLYDRTPLIVAAGVVLALASGLLTAFGKSLPSGWSPPGSWRREL